MRTEPQSPNSTVEGEWRAKRRRKLPQEQGLARITIDLPELQYKRLKIAAIEGGTTVRQLIMELLDREGINDR